MPQKLLGPFPRAFIAGLLSDGEVGGAGMELLPGGRIAFSSSSTSTTAAVDPNGVSSSSSASPGTKQGFRRRADGFGRRRVGEGDGIGQGKRSSASAVALGPGVLLARGQLIAAIKVEALMFPALLIAARKAMFPALLLRGGLRKGNRASSMILTRREAESPV
jgi:hypothetical protein